MRHAPAQWALRQARPDLQLGHIFCGIALTVHDHHVRKLQLVHLQRRPMYQSQLACSPLHAKACLQQIFAVPPAIPLLNSEIPV